MGTTTIKHASSFLSLFAKNIEEALQGEGTSFPKELFYHTDTKGLKDVDVYTRAHIDRRLFSKIRKAGYLPCKKTIIALVLALELNYTETINLLSLAGFTLSTTPSMTFDIIITKAMQKGMYDINEILYKYSLPLLGD